MRQKYGIQDYDLYNFDETGFIIGIIYNSIAIIRSDRRNKNKTV
jgi:hypothetical protein